MPKDSMKQEIETALQPLIGEPLSYMWRYAGCQKFEFGIQHPGKIRKGQDITEADWALVVSGDWRIVGPEGYLVSSADFGPGEERRDENAKAFYDLLPEYKCVVEELEVADDGGLTFKIAGGHTLSVTITTIEDDRWQGYNEFREYLLAKDEQWRFIPKDKEEGHLVCLTGSLEPRSKSQRKEIEEAVTLLGLDIGQFYSISEEEAIPILLSIKSHFIEDGKQWWWGDFRIGPVLSKHFSDGMGFQRLKQIVPPDTGMIWFVVESSFSNRHLLYRGTVRAIEAVIFECSSFEYFVVSPRLDWLICEDESDNVYAVGEVLVGSLESFGET